MSRIGNKAVEIPEKVKVNIDNDGAVSVEGPKGKLSWRLPRDIKASVKDNRVSLAREAETRSVKALHGLSRSLVHNMVQGVSEGFTKQLEIEGVGCLVKPSLTPCTMLCTRLRESPCNAFTLRVSASRASETRLSFTLALMSRGSLQLSFPLGPSTEITPSLSMLTLTFSGISTALFPIRDIK